MKKGNKMTGRETRMNRGQSDDAPMAMMKPSKTKMMKKGKSKMMKRSKRSY